MVQSPHGTVVRFHITHVFMLHTLHGIYTKIAAQLRSRGGIRLEVESGCRRSLPYLHPDPLVGVRHVCRDLSKIDFLGHLRQQVLRAVEVEAGARAVDIHAGEGVLILA